MYEVGEDPRDPGARSTEVHRRQHPASRSQVPPARSTVTALFGLSLAMSLVGGSWLSTVRTAMGGAVSHNPVLLQSLLDAVLPLPLVLMGVGCASTLASRAARRLQQSGPGCATIRAVFTSLAGALALGLVSPLAHLFSASGTAGPLLAELLDGAFLTLPVTLLLAVGFGALAARRGARRLRAAVPARRLRRPLAQLTGCAVLVSTLGIPLTAGPRAGEIAPGDRPETPAAPRCRAA